jgi:hypothetical protein
VKVAVNGQVAFEAWKDGRAGFDVVFMDMQASFPFPRVVLEIALC